MGSGLSSHLQLVLPVSAAPVQRSRTLLQQPARRRGAAALPSEGPAMEPPQVPLDPRWSNRSPRPEVAKGRLTPVEADVVTNFPKLSPGLSAALLVPGREKAN